jgi:phospholipase D-like protein
MRDRPMHAHVPGSDAGRVIINVLAITRGEPMLNVALSEGWGTTAAIGTGLAVVAYLVFFIGALISILGSAQSGGMKLIWIIFAFCAPFLGPLLWFLVGRRHVAV